RRRFCARLERASRQCRFAAAVCGNRSRDMRALIGVSIAALATLMALLSASHAQEIRSAKGMLPHCTAALQPNAQDLNGARCLGILATLSFVSRVLPDNLKFCQPSGAAPELM